MATAIRLRGNLVGWRGSGEKIVGMVKDAAKRTERNAHKKRMRGRTSAIRRAYLEELLDSLMLPPNFVPSDGTISSPHTSLSEALDELNLYTGDGVALKDRDTSISWETMPDACNMLYNATGTKKGTKRAPKPNDFARIARKKHQCESFAKALIALNLPNGSTVIDFGCGSCGLTLPLAFRFPQYHFIGVHVNATAVRLMRE